MADERDRGQRSSETRIPPHQTPFESFEWTARYLGIPQENWEHPTVREFVGLINRVNQLQKDLSNADATNSSARTQSDAEQAMIHADPSGVLEPPLSDRYSSAELLLRATFEILKGGFKGIPAHPDYIRGKLNAAIEGYGLTVVPIPKDPSSDSAPPHTGLLR